MRDEERSPTSRETRSTATGRIVWITGLAGAGKTTLARAVVDALRARGIAPLLLDGDALRLALAEPDDGFDRASRLRRAWRIARLARFAALQGIDVVVATISLFHEVQAWNRGGAAPFVEVLLDAPLDVLRVRNPALYVDTHEVVGVDVSAELPPRPEVVIRQAFDQRAFRDHVSEVLAAWDATGEGRP